MCIWIAKGIKYILFFSFFFKTNELGEQFSIKSILLNVPLLRFRYHNSLIQNENFVFGEKGEVRGEGVLILMKGEDDIIFLHRKKCALITDNETKGKAIQMK